MVLSNCGNLRPKSSRDLFALTSLNNVRHVDDIELRSHLRLTTASLNFFDGRSTLHSLMHYVMHIATSERYLPSVVAWRVTLCGRSLVA